MLEVEDAEGGISRPQIRGRRVGEEEMHTLNKVTALYVTAPDTTAVICI